MNPPPIILDLSSPASTWEESLFSNWQEDIFLAGEDPGLAAAFLAHLTKHLAGKGDTDVVTVHGDQTPSLAGIIDQVNRTESSFAAAHPSEFILYESILSLRLRTAPARRVMVWLGMSELAEHAPEALRQVLECATLGSASLRRSLDLGSTASPIQVEQRNLFVFSRHSPARVATWMHDAWNAAAAIHPQLAGIPTLQVMLQGEPPRVFMPHVPEAVPLPLNDPPRPRPPHVVHAFTLDIDAAPATWMAQLDALPWRDWILLNEDPDWTREFIENLKLHLHTTPGNEIFPIRCQASTSAAEICQQLSKRTPVPAGVGDTTQLLLGLVSGQEAPRARMVVWHDLDRILYNDQEVFTDLITTAWRASWLNRSGAVAFPGQLKPRKLNHHNIFIINQVPEGAAQDIIDQAYWHSLHELGLDGPPPFVRLRLADAKPKAGWII